MGLPLTDYIDRRPVGAQQIALVALVLLAVVVDGIDIQMLSLVSPLIIAEWGIGKAQFGPAMSAALVGMSIGASLGGWFGDRYGRKATLTGVVLLFGAATIAASQSHGMTSLVALRFISGLGFGAAAPNGIALASEWLPGRYRDSIASALSIGTPLGGMIGAGVALWLLPIAGWRGLFVICGALTVGLGLLMLVSLPESAAFLLARGRLDRVIALCRATLRGFDAHQISLPEGASTSDAGTGEAVLSRANLRLNLGIWILYFGVALISYAVAAWAPVMLTGVGIPLGEALRSTLAFNFAAVAGALLAPWIIPRLGSRSALIGAMVALGLCVITLMLVLYPGGAIAAGDMRRLIVIPVACAGIGGTAGAATAIIYALLAFAYPLRLRARGIGIGLTMGRLGGIAATMAGGAMLSLSGNGPGPFLVALLVNVVVGIGAVLLIDRHIPQRHR